MKKTLLFLLLCFSAAVFANPDGQTPNKAENNELTAQKQQILVAARTLLTQFSDTEKVVFPFADARRTQWTNLPVGIVERHGISIGEMSDIQRIKLHQLLASLFSSQGYLKTTGIMHLDNILEKHFNIPRLEWSHKNYYFAFWNIPSDTEEWGFKLEGHHLSLNFTFKDMKLSATPMFLGADPAEISETEYAGWRIFGEEEDLGFRLIGSLSEEQQNQAILDGGVPRDILTNPDSEQRLTEYSGIKASNLLPQQQQLLIRLIEEFLFNLDKDLATEKRSTLLSEGMDTLYFAWIGPKEKSDSYYYLIHSPSFIIEFDNHRNHIHAIWRVKGNDFGADILQAHLTTNEHHKPRHDK